MLHIGCRHGLAADAGVSTNAPAACCSPTPLPPCRALQEDRRRSRDRSGSRRRSRSRDRKRRSRSKSRDRKRRSRSRDRGDRSRGKERERERSRERRRERPRSPERTYRRPRSPPRRREVTPPEVRAERERAAEMEALDRDTRTVFAYNLPLRAEEKEIFQFFIKAGALGGVAARRWRPWPCWPRPHHPLALNTRTSLLHATHAHTGSHMHLSPHLKPAPAGPLNDIKVITDKTTGRSKGFAYIEFQRKEDVINALALTGQVLMGQAVMVKMSEAEKNLAWEAAEQAKRQQKELERELGPGAMAAPLLPPPMPPGMPGMVGLAMPMAPMVAAGPARLALSNLPTSITGGCLQPAVLGPSSLQLCCPCTSLLCPCQHVPLPARSLLTRLCCCARCAAAETDLRPIFEPFGALDFLTLQRDTAARPTGNGFVQ